MEATASYSNKSFPRDKNDKSVSFTGSVLPRMWPDECFDRGKNSQALASNAAEVKRRSESLGTVFWDCTVSEAQVLAGFVPFNSH